MQRKFVQKQNLSEKDSLLKYEVNSNMNNQAFIHSRRLKHVAYLPKLFTNIFKTVLKVYFLVL